MKVVFFPACLTHAFFNSLCFASQNALDKILSEWVLFNKVLFTSCSCPDRRKDIGPQWGVFSYPVSPFILLNSGCKIGRNTEFPSNWTLKSKAHLCLKDRDLTNPIWRNSTLSMSYQSRNIPFHQVGFTFQLEKKLLIKEQSFCFRKVLYGAES